MRTEKEKMLAGELYLGFDPELVAERIACRRLLQKLNQSDPADLAARQSLLAQLLGEMGENAYIEPPFFCDYGSHIYVGARFYANFQCVILDCARIEIGDDVFFGPGVHVYAATHPLDAAERVKGPELARPVSIGSRVWVGGGSIILPGVRIGDDTTIGAGSVVTRDVPAGVLAAGNPCRVLRKL
ncbi:MAG: sugar O-acetyltransferase [Myxococcales bacterium]|jgi:maltose O-acetyltransferase